MTTDPTNTPPPIPGTIEANDLVVRGNDGDPLPAGTRMLERESYERVVEGLKIASDACLHLARQEDHNAHVWSIAGVGAKKDAATRDAETWRAICRLIDSVRYQAVALARIDHPGALNPTPALEGSKSMTWRQARDRFLNGIAQATGGMRQIATCFRADLQWSMLAQELERRQTQFEAVLYGRPVRPQQRIAPRPLILPPGYSRH